MVTREHELCASLTPRAERIAQLNDQLRKAGTGGRIVVTRGVQELAGFCAQQLLTQLASYDAFDADNDPHGERDFGEIECCGAELLWKTDPYNLTMTWGSSDPADPRVTARVLTIMLATEY